MEMNDMKDRIAHIIRAKNLTAAEFALRLGIQPSNVSHILAGRNNPSLEFVKKLKETFPEYNTDWIIFGKGPMTVSEPFLEQKTVVAPVVQNTIEPELTQNEADGNLFVEENEAMSPLVPPLSSYKVGLKQIIMVYEDNTFEVLQSR